MKLLRLAALTLTTAALLPQFCSCSSDPNPFDVSIEEPQGSLAFIRLNLQVADTRAGDLSTAAEKKISKVNIYVFNEKHELETTKTNVAVGEGETSVTMEVTHGLKTIYVITAQSVVNPSVGTAHTNFEQSVFASSVDKLNTSDGFVMMGKSAEQQVMISASLEDMPSSNVFSITLTRLAAKAQVKAAGIDGSKFGFTLGSASFKASQTSERMMLIHNGSDLVDKYVDSNSNGTYDNYAIGESSPYMEACSDFSAEGCVYMPENIVAKPLSGNTTFLSIRIAATPKQYYTFAAADSAPKTMSETPAAGTTYYVVGIVDKEHGVSDYTVDGTTNQVYAFKNQEDAQRYMSSLNNGEVSPFTVSQTESQLKAPGSGAADARTAQFEVFEYRNGYAYYRVNIAHEEKSGDSTVMKNKVVRNKFYKVNVNSVKNLGFCSEALLRPTNAAATLDAEGSSWISASFTIAEWDEVTQNVDLM